MSKNNFQYCSISISFIQSSFKTSTSTYKLLIPKGMCNLSFYANTNTTKFFMNKTEYKLLNELFIFSNSIEIGRFQQTYFYSINIDTYHKLNLILSIDKKFQLLIKTRVSRTLKFLSDSIEVNEQ